ncbi:MAG TPA: ISAs1 family transposase, partial [Candidatus Babeliales bacterium]|nr:ISAs1 family transposase [Candidatus Babeliales bacterium]
NWRLRGKDGIKEKKYDTQKKRPTLKRRFLMSIILHEIWHNYDHLANLIACLEEVTDPRINRCKKHELVVILLIAILAIFSGAKNWVHVVRFAHDHQQWLHDKIWLPNGIPSHDTFHRVFLLLNPKELRDWLLLWLEVALHDNSDHIAIDGKVIEAWSSKNPFTLINAFSPSSKIVLEQARVPDGNNELTGMDRVLDTLNLKGKVITIDAMGTRKLFVKKIITRGGNYILPVKLNNRLLCEDINLFLHTLAQGEHEEIAYKYHETIDYKHGRKETRKCYSTEYIDWIYQKKEWANLKSITLIESKVENKGTCTNNRRLFISSLPADPKRILGYVRAHWSIENHLHRSLDVNFNDDQRSLRKGHGAQNFNFLSAFVNSLLTRKPSCFSLENKLRRGNSDPNFILDTLMNPGF